MTTAFYQLPQGITKQLNENVYLDGKVVCPFDPDLTLTNQLKKLGVDCEGNADIERALDIHYWRALKEQGTNWIVVNTSGADQRVKEYILNYSTDIATEGIALLDRLSFLEPAKGRKEFLLANKLSNLVVLHPRPNFRAVGGKKDSVTSAWFVFRKKENWQDGVDLSFALSWQGTESLPTL